MTAQEEAQERSWRNQLVSLNTQITREKLRPQPDQGRLGELNAQLEQVRLEYEAFQVSLYAAHSELKTRRAEFQAVSPDDARALLPEEKSALIEFVVAEGNSYAFVITREPTGKAQVDIRVHALGIGRKDLAERTERFRGQLASRDPAFRDSARALYDLLLKPASAQLQGKTAWIIVPDATLWDLPFQALQSGPNRYVIEDHTIAYAPSLTVLREMKKARWKKAAPSTLLAFGNPALGRETVERAKLVLMADTLDPLPEAESQVRTIGRLYGAARSKVYIGVEAREERVKAEAGGYRILHLATHGVLNDASPMYSHVLLARSDIDATEDGLLEAWELLKLDLNADLVVLSACETARGRVGAGEGVIGLSWALFVAGVPTTVVSQWKVDSASTTGLMVEFHRRLHSQNRGPARLSVARALQGAALKLLRDPFYRHPFYWAGFVAIGDAY